MASRQFGTIEAKNGKLRARYNAPDGTRPSKVFPKNAKTVARAWLNSEHARITAGTWKSKAQERAEREEADRQAAEDQFTVDDFVPEWFATMRRRGFKPKTKQVHWYRYARHVKPTFGSTPLKSLTEKSITRWYDRLIVDASPGVPSSVVLTFSALLNQAVKLGYLDRNPMNLPGATKHRPVRRRSAEERVATVEQVEALTAAMVPHLAIAVPIAAWLELREGEILELRKSDLNLDEGFALPSRQVQFITGTGAVVTTTKNDEDDVEVAIPAAMIPALTRHILQFAGPGDDGLIVPHPRDRTKHLHPNSFRKKFNEARAQVDGMENFVFHDLRHTGLTMYARYGATTKELMRRGRHKSLSSAMKYQHAEKQRDHSLAERMSEEIATMFGA